MISNERASDSETTLMSAIHKLSDAGGSLIQIRTREPQRAAIVLRKHLIGSDSPYKEWDVVNGWRSYTRENYTEHRVVGQSTDFLEALAFPMSELRGPTSVVNSTPGKIHYFVYVNPHVFVANNPVASEMLQQYANFLPATNCCLLLITPETKLDVPAGTALVTEMPTPTHSELSEVMDRMLRDAGNDKKSFPGGIKVDKAGVIRIANMGLGLSLYEFETYVAISIIDAGEAGKRSLDTEFLLEGVAKGKTAVVKESEILELTHPESIDNIGGMQKMKDWLKARAGCYSEDARAFGIEPPKGMVLVGIPGSGKSLSAKVTASVLGVPLVRLDFGRVFSKYVGDSESRMREALRMVEAMAPVALFADEIDKGLGGASGGGDSGTSSRVLGSFLTWLQECKAPVFVVVTANRVDGLPPELLRRGRFDQIWSVSMPDESERREVLAIHLRRREREIGDFTEAEIQDFLSASNGYVPAEIESAVKDALVLAFNDTEAETLEMRHIVTALKEMIPMSKSHKEAIDRILAWARDNAVPVSYPLKSISEGAAPARLLRGRARN